MDGRIVIGATFALVLLAVAGFYIGLSSRSGDIVPPPAKIAMAPPPKAPDRSPAQAAAPASPPQAAPVSPPTPAKATAASVEDEIAHSDHAELQALLKKNFADEYAKLIAVAVQRRNEGAADQQFSEELFAQFQDLMRPKLKYAVGASTPMIDKLAANEADLFHALGTDGAAFCMKMLGKDATPASTPPPPRVRELIRLGTLYRFQAIVDGMPKPTTVEPLTAQDMNAFEASLAQDGLKFEDVRTGAFLNNTGQQPGAPCLMLEKLYRAIARLPEGTRRKIYAGMFFLGRDK